MIVVNLLEVLMLLRRELDLEVVDLMKEVLEDEMMVVMDVEEHKCVCCWKGS